MYLKKIRPKNWHFCQNPTHWSNAPTNLQYAKKILYPFIKKHRRDAGYPPEEPALLIVDDFSANKDDDLWKYLESKKIHRLLVPA